MPELFGQASWPGCDDFISCTYSYGHGTTPGVATFVTDERNARQAATFGDLTLTDGINTGVLKDCKVSSIDYNGHGVYTLQILDRRWKWAFTSVVGQYNQRDHKNQIKPWQRETLEHLAKKCLIEMGETDNVGDLPALEKDDDLPAVDWVFVNAAQALTDLVEPFGCRIVFRPFENDTVISKIGEGADLPDLDYESFTPSFDLPEKPEKLALIGAEVAYTCAFALEAVGAEPWGEIKPIDELSYKPAAGWGVSPPPYFPNLTIPDINPAVGIFFPGIKVSQLTAAEYRALAKTCIFRWYRITLQPLSGDKFKQPGLDDREFPARNQDGTNAVADQYFKLLKGILTVRRDDNGVVIVDPPRVHGVFNRGASNYWTNTDKTESITEGITIDSDRGIVKFDRYMFRINPTASAIAAAIAGGLVSDPVSPWKIGPAELVLVCSAAVRSANDHQFDRTQRLRTLIQGGDNKSYRIIHREEIQEIKYAEFSPSTWQVKGTDDNAADVNAAANHVIDGAEQEYQIINAGTRKYPGIMLTKPDGALQQFTYTVGGGGAPFTTISRNTEHVAWMPSLEKQRGGQRVKLIVDLVQQPSSFLTRLLPGTKGAPGL